ncbi:MAG: polymerase subunit sigma-70 [Acidimicrobiales bacterium]|nr:polymerase subunit sigma-70 [Acidimicrobiales bacterium]
MMDERDGLSVQFEANRRRLRALAYRMLGSPQEADDVVQDAWLRVGRADAALVQNLGGWLTTIVARICLDRLRARRARPEEPTDVERHDARRGTGPPGPEDEAVLAESVGAALLVVLDLLAPAERVAFVLHDVFAVPYDEIGVIVGRSPDAARQLASRARRRVQGGSSTGADVDLRRQRELVEAFLAAARGDDFDALLAALDPDVVFRSDAAAARMGSCPEAHGANAVASFIRGGARFARLALVDGVAGLAWVPGGAVRGAIQFTIVNDRIVQIDAIGEPERLEALEVVVLEG